LTDEYGGTVYVERSSDGQTDYLTHQTGGESKTLILKVRFKSYWNYRACPGSWVLDVRGGGSASNFSGFLP